MDTLSISVKTAEEKKKLMERIRVFPGNDDKSRLEALLAAGEETLRVHTPNDTVLGKVEEVLHRVLPIVEAELCSKDMIQEEAIAKKEQAITALETENQRLRQENQQLCSRELIAQAEIKRLKGALTEQETAVKDKDALIKSLQAQVNNQVSNQEAYQALRTDLDRLMKEMVSGQVTFLSQRK